LHSKTDINQDLKVCLVRFEVEEIQTRAINFTHFFVQESLEHKFGEGRIYHMQMHHHDYKLLICSCLYMTIVIIDLLCVVQKKYEVIWRHVN